MTDEPLTDEERSKIVSFKTLSDLWAYLTAIRDQERRRVSETSLLRAQTNRHMLSGSR